MKISKFIIKLVLGRMLCESIVSTIDSRIYDLQIFKINSKLTDKLNTETDIIHLENLRKYFN